MVRQVLILLGAPGAGKGTQAVRLADALSLPHVSTGDLFRENLSQGTPLGEKAKGYMDSGALVPDELVVDMLFDRVGRDDCGGGYLLDGFPRTVAQAEALGSRLGADDRVRVIDIEVPDSAIVERITGRLSCGGCGAVFHKTFNPPAAEGSCDRCGGALSQRADDSAEVVEKRLGQVLMSRFARAPALCVNGAAVGLSPGSCQAAPRGTQYVKIAAFAQRRGSGVAVESW